MADIVKMMIDGIGDLTKKILGQEVEKEIIMFSEQSNSHDLYMVLRQFVEQERFCEAEDLLYAELDKGYTEGKYLAGVEFYEMLREADEAVLIRSNFPPNEIDDGVRELARYKEEYGGEMLLEERAAAPVRNKKKGKSKKKSKQPRRNHNGQAE